MNVMITMDWKKIDNWLRHPNGNGKIVGNDALVSADSFLHRDSVVINRAEVYSSRIGRNCLIAQDTRVVNSFIEDCLFKGNARAYGGCLLLHVDMEGRATVAGPAQIIGSSERRLVLPRLMWIDRGTWSRLPFYAEIGSEAESVHVGITESTDGQVAVGCRVGHIDWWLKIGDRYGRAAGWTPEQVYQLRLILMEWRSLLV